MSLEGSQFPENYTCTEQSTVLPLNHTWYTDSWLCQHSVRAKFEYYKKLKIKLRKRFSARVFGVIRAHSVVASVRKYTIQIPYIMLAVFALLVSSGTRSRNLFLTIIPQMILKCKQSTGSGAL